jgi:retron-type reverse transcriptase
MSDTKDDPLKKLKAQLSALPDATVRERMIALGFWPPGEPLPADPIDEANARSALESDRARLLAQAGTAENPEKALRRERIRRLRESQKRRTLRKLERENEKKARRAAWDAEKADRIVHAGEGVSAGLAQTGSDAEKLSSLGLPVLHHAGELAERLGLSISQLRFLTYHRRGATLVHYHRFGIPKKTGGIRAISAPKPALARAHRWVLAQVLDKLEVRAPAHGFVRHRSIVTNAAPHVGRRVVLNLDLESFFPTVGFRRVKGLFRKLGYAEQVATLLALLCTEPPRVEARLDGKRLWIALGQRVLPQGACTSPAITNAICRRLDARLSGLAKHFGFTYTRYADDLTFSGDDRSRVGRLLGCVRKVVTSEGFREHGDKTHVMGSGRRQEVTGVVVNQKLSTARDERRALRAMLHNVARRGLAAENREGHADFASYLQGRVAFACMVDPSLEPVLRPALDRALARG